MTVPGPVETLHGTPARFAGGMTEVAPGTYAWLQPNGDWSESNAGLVVGDGVATLIDTAWDLPLTRRILRAADIVGGMPISTLIVTHGDGDHVNGCQLLPNARMIASRLAAQDIAHEDPAGLRRSHLGARFLRTATIGPPRRFGSYIGAMFDPFDFRGIDLRAPDDTFDEHYVAHVGGRDLRIERLGPAHTAGDSIVHVPDVRTVFAGDLVFVGVTPNTWAGAIGGWRRALERIADLAPSVVVPGHGPVTDLAGVEAMDRYWAWLEQEATRLLASGRSVEQATRDIVFGEAFAGQPWAEWLSVERTLCNVLVIDRGRRGLSTAISHHERPRLMWGVARLASELAARERQGGAPAAA